MKLRILAPLVLAMALAGCSTIISGTTQAVTIDSNVKGATVSIEGNNVGVTPFAGKISRKRDSIAMVSKDGYTSQPITLSSAFNPLTILSIVFWDLGTTDCLTGACWEYAPASYYVNLRREGTSENRFRIESTVKAYAMTYHGELVTELAAGNGHKLEGLRQSHFAAMTEQEFLHLLRQANTSDAIGFGESVASLLVR